MSKITANQSGKQPMSSQPPSWGGLVKQVELLIEDQKYREAEMLALEALAISEDYPPDDNRQGITLELLVDIYYHTKQYIYAAPVMMRLLQMYRRCLGVGHEDTATVTFNAGRLYHDWKKYDEAEAFYKLSLKLKTDLYGETHQEAQAVREQMQKLVSDMQAPRLIARPVITRKENRMKKTGQWDALKVD